MMIVRSPLEHQKKTLPSEQTTTKSSFDSETKVHLRAAPDQKTELSLQGFNQVYEQEIALLKQALFAEKEKNEAITAKLAQIRQNKKSRHDNFKVSISKDELSQQIPEPFVSTVTALDADFAQKFMDYYREEQDPQWAYQVEDKIRDAISLNDMSPYIQIESVICKKSVCEIRGFQSESHAWMKVSQALMSADWWDFRNAQSSSEFKAEYGDYFYAILSK